MISPEKYRQSLNLVRNAILAVAILALTIQFFVDSSAENIQSNLLCITAILLGCFLIIHPRSSRGGAAFSGAAILLSIFSNSLIPMMGTLMEGHSLTYTLENPVECFGHRLVFAVILLAAHFIADSALGRSSKSVLGNLSDMAGLRTILSPKQIWIVGIGGVLLQAILRSGLLGDGAISKLLQGMAFLATVPFILAIPPFSKILKKQPLWIAGLVGLYLLGAFIGITSRMSLVGPIALIASAYLVAILSGQAQLPSVNPFKGIAIILAAIFAAGQLADLSDAIISVRDRRNERSVAGNIQATFTNFFDKEYLKQYKKQKAMDMMRLESKYGEFWKEDYIDNPFLSRFTGIKFDDNLFSTAKHYTPSDVLTIKAITKDKIYAMMPQPVLSAFDIKVDKAFIITFSMGDLMDVLVNRNGFLGGFRVGSITVHSFIVFGWWYPLWLTLFFVVLFLIFQTVGIPEGKSGRATGISTFALVYGFTLYMAFGMDGYYLLISMFIRGAWQVFLFYGLAIWLAKVVAPTADERAPGRGSRPRRPRRPRPSPPAELSEPTKGDLS